MKRKLWALCPHCGKVTPADRRMLCRIVCQYCDEEIGKENRDLIGRDCPGCDRRILAPAYAIDDVLCPCGYGAVPDEPEPMPEPAPAPEPEPKPERKQKLNLRCKKCAANYVLRGDLYRCPVCGAIPSREELVREEYLSSADEAINISVDNAHMTGHLLFVHPHSGHIPAHSTLVVDDYQFALYRAGGHFYQLEAGTYSLFWDERSEKEIRESLPEGRFDDAYPVQIDTKVIFFDRRGLRLNYRAPQVMPIQDTNYGFRLNLNYQLRIENPRQMMSNAFDTATNEQEEQVLSMVRGWAEEALYDEYENRVAHGFDGEFTPGGGNIQLQLRQTLQQLLSTREIEDAVNRKLNADNAGISVHIIRLDWNSALESSVTVLNLEYCAPEALRVRGSNYSFRPRLDYQLSIEVLPGAMGSAGDGADLARGQVEKALFSEYSERLLRGLGSNFRPGDDEEYELLQALPRLLPIREIEDAVNAKLRGSYRNAQIHIIQQDWNKALERVEELIPERERARCPGCGKIIRRQTGEFRCPGCGARLWTCDFCRTVNPASQTICTNEKCKRRGRF